MSGYIVAALVWGMLFGYILNGIVVGSGRHEQQEHGKARW